MLFTKNIKFTFETERNNMLSFLDVLVIKRPDGFDTAVFRKETHTDLYLHWDSFAPLAWKRSTFKLLVKRAFNISSTNYLLEMELEHLKDVFININGYPLWLIKQTIKQVKEERNTVQLQINNRSDNNNETTKKLQLTLPYAGKEGETVLKSLRSNLSQSLPENTETRITYTGTKLGSKFNVKDRISLQDQHDVVYLFECPEETCSQSYIGETGRRLIIRTEEHKGKDKNSLLYKHSIETGHKTIEINDVKIIGKQYEGNSYKRKVSEALFIKHQRPHLNIQDMSVRLKLFN